MALPFPTVEQSANWIRSKFQLMMGSLSGFPYNVQIVTGGTIVATVTARSAPPPGAGLTAIVADPSGTIVYNQGAVAPLTLTQTVGTYTATLKLNATMNVSWDYLVTLQAVLPQAGALAPDYFSLPNLTVTGNDLYAGIAPEVAFPTILSGGTATLTFEENGQPLPGTAVTVVIQDENLQTPGQSVSGITDANGVVSLTFSYLTFSDVGYWLQWQTVEASGRAIVTGAELSTGFTDTIDIGEAPQGAADSVLVSVTLNGTPQPGATVTGQLLWAGPTGTGTPLGPYTTGSAGTVVVPLDPSVIAQSDSFSLMLTAMYTDILGEKTGLYNETVTAEQLSSGSLSVTVAMQGPL